VEKRKKLSVTGSRSSSDVLSNSHHRTEFMALNNIQNKSKVINEQINLK
jgi:hypothetical protein